MCAKNCFNVNSDGEQCNVKVFLRALGWIAPPTHVCLRSATRLSKNLSSDNDQLVVADEKNRRNHMSELDFPRHTMISLMAPRRTRSFSFLNVVVVCAACNSLSKGTATLYTSFLIFTSISFTT
jgi:hypothetical protein